MSRVSRTFWTTLVALLGVMSCAVDAHGIPALPPRQEQLAPVAAGVVWVDEGRVLLSGGSPAKSRTLGSVQGESYERRLASSMHAVALLARERWLGSVLPAPLSPIPEPPARQGGGCVGWLPATGEASDFAVVDDELVSASECERSPELVGEQRSSFTRQPLFVRDLRSGRWRVLRWLGGGEPPLLTADGNLLAVAEQILTTVMRVTLLEPANNRVEARFDAPDGYLSFASRKRLVLSMPRPLDSGESAFPLPPAIDGYREQGSPCELSLYSTNGRRLATLGSASSLPAVSNMHLALEESSGEGVATVSVRSVAGGQPRPVIGFDRPARGLLGMAFNWPTLTVAQTTSSPLAQSEVSCWGSEYGPASSPFLGSFDLAREEPFDAPPPLVHLTRPPLATCGPPPPAAEGP